jgi:hypothetical protein
MTWSRLIASVPPAGPPVSPAQPATTVSAALTAVMATHRDREPRLRVGSIDPP